MHLKFCLSYFHAQIIERIGGRLGEAYLLDKNWITKIERESAKVTKFNSISY